MSFKVVLPKSESTLAKYNPDLKLDPSIVASFEFGDNVNTALPKRSYTWMEDID